MGTCAAYDAGAAFGGYEGCLVVMMQRVSLGIFQCRGISDATGQLIRSETATNASTVREEYATVGLEW